MFGLKVAQLLLHRGQFGSDAGERRDLGPGVAGVDLEAVAFGGKCGDLIVEPRELAFGAAGLRGRFLSFCELGAQFGPLLLSSDEPLRDRTRPAAFVQRVLQGGDFLLLEIALRGGLGELVAQLGQLSLRITLLLAQGFEHGEPFGQVVALLARLFEVGFDSPLLRAQLAQLDVHFLQAIALRDGRRQIVAEPDEFRFRALALGAQLCRLLERGGELLLLALDLLVGAVGRAGQDREFAPGADCHGRGRIGWNDQGALAARAVHCHARSGLVHGDPLLAFGAVELDVSHKDEVGETGASQRACHGAFR